MSGAICTLLVWISIGTLTDRYRRSTLIYFHPPKESARKASDYFLRTVRPPALSIYARRDTDGKNEVTLDQPLVRSYEGNTWSAKSLAQVKDWIAHCQQNHGSLAHQCPTGTGSFRPTRLIDVGLVVYLRDTESLPNQDHNTRTRRNSVSLSSYVTLSHSWGGTLSKKLVQESINDFQQGIRLIDLPKTLQDAVYVTRKLGVKYLWIDALCIIQGSRSDWLAEASVMGEVYANSYVNIAATASADSHGGLFHSRNPLSVVPCLVSVSGSHQTRGTYICRPLHQSYHNIDCTILNSRAWVLQERALAPRTLHCARDQLYWQCSSMIAGQCFPRGTSSEITAWNIRAWKKVLTEATDSAESDYTWYWLALDYSVGDLAYLGDKLVALSGLAKQWGQLRGFPSSSYLAGLWLPHLPYSLCWYTRTLKCTRPTHYRAPSWCWTSVDGPILSLWWKAGRVWQPMKYAQNSGCPNSYLRK